MSVGHCFANFKNCYNKKDVALCKKFDEIYEYGKLLREKRRCFGKVNLSKVL